MNECRECGGDFIGNGEFCSVGCEENWTERASQRQIESYYGGDGPQTDRERYVKAWEEKRRW